jgi:uncharacterized membrane protein (UPF0127 family)
MSVVLVALAACGGSGDGDPGSAGSRLPAATRAAQDVRQNGGVGVDAERGLTRRAGLRVAGIPITVEIADDPATRSRGLMDRDSLPRDQGMLFVYSEEKLLSFWMRNTRIPLDIAFIDGNGIIVDIQSMDPYDEQSRVSRQPAMYALEMNRGWFEEQGVTVGDRVEF